MFLIIDNYDSFTFNLSRYIEELDEEVEVYRCNHITVDEIRHINPLGIIISPGPKSPKEAKESLNIINEFKKDIPILGVCLGHQCIGEVFGGKIVKGTEPVHGKISKVTHKEKGIFKGIKNPINVTRYHSLIIDRETIPKELYVTAITEDGVIMGIEHRDYSIYGVQFHPEAELTECGHLLLNNFINICRERIRLNGGIN
ncbi:Aminodeoxychorismate synthase component 2 [compost metagenome]